VYVGPFRVVIEALSIPILTLCFRHDKINNNTHSKLVEFETLFGEFGVLLTTVFLSESSKGYYCR
jgi:hypothetical protein